ncbi:hypothetical protein KHQ88_00975 [Mycoplasmatota bacterium]|nr:hypothetical protein KHQ88_00975 [Mycoplasmatota bacterium]
MKSKKLVIGLLLLLAVVFTTGTFAYWASGVNGPTTDGTTTGTVNIGQGEAVETSFVLTGSPATGGNLVPANQLSNSPAGSVDEVNVTYGVQWTEDGTTSQLAGTTSTAPITITWVITADNSGNDVSTLANTLITVTPNVGNLASLTLDAAPENFSFAVTMTEPADQDEYNDISGATITITFTYSLGSITTTDNN